MAPQLTLLRGPHQADGADTIQLTNPELRRNPEDKTPAETSLARTRAEPDPCSPHRRRPARAGHGRQLLGHRRAPRLELALGVDMADIFEVRGYPRAEARERSCRSSSMETGRRSPTTASTERAGRRRSSRPTRRSSRSTTPTRGSARSVLATLADGARAGCPCDHRLAASRPARTTTARRPVAAVSGAARSTAPPDPRRRAGRAAVRRAADPVRPRAARPDAGPLAGRPRHAAQRRSRRRRVVPGRRDPLVRDAVRARQPDRRARDGRVHAERWRSPRSRSWPGSRRRATTRGTTRSRARSSTRCGPARWRGPARRRTTPTTGASIRRRCG